MELYILPCLKGLWNAEIYISTFLNTEPAASFTRFGLNPDKHKKIRDNILLCLEINSRKQVNFLQLEAARITCAMNQKGNWS